MQNKDELFILYCYVNEYIIINRLLIVFIIIFIRDNIGLIRCYSHEINAEVCVKQMKKHIQNNHNQQKNIKKKKLKMILKVLVTILIIKN